MTNIKWGIIGPGNIAAKFAEAILKMDDVVLHAVASRTRERAIEFGGQYDIPIEKCYGSYEELVQDSNVDVIYIAVPHPFHKEISIMCMDHGKAVLCEKPVTICEAEIKEVITSARKNNVFFMEAMKTRFLPVHQRVKAVVDSGLIGDVRLLQADFGFKAPFDSTHRLFNKELGGGALLDVGIYNVSYSSFLFGNHPVTVNSDLTYGKTGVDESVAIQLSYVNGSVAQLYGSINLQTSRYANIIGTEGRISIPNYSNAEEAIIYWNGDEERIQVPHVINGFEYQIQEVVNHLQVGKLECEIMSWDDSIEIMRIMDLAKR